jgi:hypothetical protein
VNPTTVRVDLNLRGGWEVVLSDRADRVTCESLEEASRLAHRCAADRQPCELIVCDAYHRVIEHGLIESGESGKRLAPTAGSSR